MILQNIPTTNKPSFTEKIKRWFFALARLNNNHAVKLYSGFGNGTYCFISGHALALSPLDRKTHRHNMLYNALWLLRLFMIKPVAGAVLQMEWDGELYSTISEKDGFFKFEWQPKNTVAIGCYTVQVNLIGKENGHIAASGSATLTVPSPSRFSFISDIDDTFLISHSTNILKRLLVLLTKNALSRRPFNGVVRYYQLLQSSGGVVFNPFFYVSSSEWNLYSYIQRFSRHNKLPEGVYFLSQIKKLHQLFKTGQSKHNTKFGRIEKLISAFPNQQFVLLGDDSQEDPNIYAAIAKVFNQQIFCVYIRSSAKTLKPNVVSTLQAIEKTGIHCFYFYHSNNAIVHSKQIRLIETSTK